MVQGVRLPTPLKHAYLGPQPQPRGPRICPGPEAHWGTAEAGTFTNMMDLDSFYEYGTGYLT